MSQNIILTRALHYLINKRVSLELTSRWNNINMASSIHMSHSLFCFVFNKNEDVALSSDISNEWRYKNYFCLRKTIMVTQLQEIFCKIAGSEENMSSSTFIGRNEECRKVFTNASNRLRHEKKKNFLCTIVFFSYRLSPCLSLDVCLSACLSVCVPAYAGVSYYGCSIFRMVASPSF